MGIVKSHSGFILAASEQGRGSAFHTYFAAEPGEPVDANGVGEMEAFRGAGQCILVVEDEVSVRSIMHKTLSANGYHVLTACDGTDAMAVFSRSQEQIQLVLTDLSMPLMDGAATICALRRLDANLPIILASGMLPDNQEAEIKRQGIQGLLLKPFTAEKLLEVIHGVLSAPKTLE
jgi:CheY-like chemotaxis protein